MTKPKMVRLLHLPTATYLYTYFCITSNLNVDRALFTEYELGAMGAKQDGKLMTVIENNKKKIMFTDTLYISKAKKAISYWITRIPSMNFGQGREYLKLEHIEIIGVADAKV